MAKDNWTTANIRTILIKEVKKIIESDIGKKNGFTNANQFIDWAVKEKVEELEKKGFRSVTIKENIIEIFDENLGENGELVSIHHNKNKLNCLECNLHNCIHINYIWSINHIADRLEADGFDRTEKICPKCGITAKEIQIEKLFGHKKIKGKIFTHPYCKNCTNKL